VRSLPDWIGSQYISGSILVDVQMCEQGDAALDPFRGGKPPLSARQRILRMRERHGEGLGDDDGSPRKSRCSMSLLDVVAFQADGFTSLPFWSPFPLVMVADRQHQRVGDIAVGAEQAHFSAREAFEQSPESRFIAIAAFPVDEPLGHAVVGLPEPDLVVFALQEGPYLIAFNYPHFAGRRLGAAEILRQAAT
jgi:hypothetical protein